MAISRQEHFRRETRFNQIVNGKDVFYPSSALEFLANLEQIKQNEAIILPAKEMSLVSTSTFAHAVKAFTIGRNE